MSTEGFDAAILAGGRSSRMGRDKALLTVSGRTLLDRQVELCWSLGPGAVWVSGRAEDELRGVRARALPDDAPHQGPLGGLATVLGASRAAHVLVLAVDMPAVTAQLLTGLLAGRSRGVGVVPRTSAGWEPTVAVYPTELAAAARAALAARALALHELVEEAVERGRLIPLDLDDEARRQLVNWNEPGDVRPP
jgi:molybdenum cofactor guanylyltransferase